MLKAKVDAGAARAITQVFFDNDLYFRYLDRVRARGIDIPIVPGIMPMHNFKQARNFVTRAGTSVPDWLAEKFEGLDDDAETRKLVAATVAAGQVQKLAKHGVDTFHFYTMNRADLVFAISHLLGIRPRRAESRLTDDHSRISEANRLARGRPRTHPGARRRHGHHDPGPRI